MTELRFDGRSAIVTGAGRGVGRAHALLLAARGASVVVADLGGQLDGSGSSSDPADEVVKEIEAAGGKAVACYASVASEDGARSMVQAAIDSFGSIDVLVNNAGIAAPDRFGDLADADFRRMADVHYFGTVNVVRAAWPHMVEAGYGRIVNTCSEAAFGITPKATPYGGGKGGVFGFSRSLATECLGFGIRVNMVAPRANTRLSAPEVLAKTYDVPVEAFADFTTMAAFRPELVSPAAAYLAHESCNLNGEVLVAGAGQVFRIAVLANEGITHDDLSPEHVADGIERVMDMSGAHVIEAATLMGED
jgi:NAD(P)-dependent dehydrogenase (short-subunit alcohol dehydrogenase family)